MAELVNVTFEDNRGTIKGNIDEFFDHARARFLVKEAMEDIADAIEVQAKKEAPLGPTGRLQAHPVEREDARVGIVTSVPAIGGGTSVRGAGGRFVAATKDFPVGQEFVEIRLGIPEEPKHAIWVHDGTGIYEPGGSGKMITAHDPQGFMTFPASRWPTAKFKRKEYRFKEVKGQPANPYLDRAFFTINGTYVQARIQLLRAQIAAET